MIDLMETIRDAEAAGDTTTFQQAQKQLGDLLFFLGASRRWRFVRYAAQACTARAPVGAAAPI